jgi:hypothetical protein
MLLSETEQGTIAEEYRKDIDYEEYLDRIDLINTLEGCDVPQHKIDSIVSWYF